MVISKKVSIKKKKTFRPDDNRRVSIEKKNFSASGARRPVFLNTLLYTKTLIFFQKKTTFFHFLQKSIFH